MSDGDRSSREAKLEAALTRLAGEAEFACGVIGAMLERHQETLIGEAHFRINVCMLAARRDAEALLTEAVGA